MLAGKATFNNGPKSLPRNPAECIISDSFVFKNFVLADDLFAKALERLVACLSVNNSLWGKLVSSLPIDNNLIVTSVCFLLLILIFSAVKLVTLCFLIFLIDICSNKRFSWTLISIGWVVLYYLGLIKLFKGT